jgi:hypothetical protein
MNSQVLPTLACRVSPKASRDALFLRPGLAATISNIRSRGAILDPFTFRVDENLNRAYLMCVNARTFLLSL